MGLTPRISFLLLASGLAAAVCACSKVWVPVSDSGYGDTSVPLPGEDEVWTDVTGNVAVGRTRVVGQTSETFMRGYWPDGKLIPVKKGDVWQLFWCESTDAMTVASTPYPEDHIPGLVSGSEVWGKGFAEGVTDGFNDGGSWFIAIYPLDTSGNYVGFFHAESHWDDSGTAHKSIGVVYSGDYGQTWHGHEPVITDKSPKPETPAWTGLGDGCVIWDEASSMYICYYQGRISSGANAICMAASTDRNGRSGTWLKWDGSGFTIPAYDKSTGLGGENIPVAGLLSVPGANPSVMWNTFLGKWVMVYASWGKQVYMSFSDDALTWSTPELITGSKDAPACYPNLISGDGDLEGGETVTMYWSHNQDGLTGIREMAYAKIRFKK